MNILYEVKDWIRAAYQFDLPVFLIGHSMGGLIAIRLLQQEEMNLAGVVLSSPCLGLVQAPSKLLNLFSYPLNVIIPSFRMNSGVTVDMATRNDEVREADMNDTLYVTKVSIQMVS